MVVPRGKVRVLLYQQVGFQFCCTNGYGLGFVVPMGKVRVSLY